MLYLHLIMKQLTIFTPTYNRKHTLDRLYQSLRQQDCKDFVWLIVDDGSTDGTEQVVKEWHNEGVIDIWYYLQPNGGKMRAHNRGVKECKTELFMCLDSDDMLTSPRSVSELLAFWNEKASVAHRPDICGIISFKKIIGKDHSFQQTTVETLTLEGLRQYSDECETSLTFKTDVLRQYPFPEIEGEKFVTEAVVYDLLDQKYQYLLFPVYTQTCEYQDDGYSRNYLKVMLANPKGYQLYYNQLVRLKKERRIYHTRMYIATSLLAHDKKMFQKTSSKTLFLLFWPMGYMQYRRLKKGRW